MCKIVCTKTLDCETHVCLVAALSVPGAKFDEADSHATNIIARCSVRPFAKQDSAALRCERADQTGNTYDPVPDKRPTHA